MTAKIYMFLNVKAFLPKLTIALGEPCCTNMVSIYTHST